MVKKADAGGNFRLSGTVNIQFQNNIRFFLGYSGWDPGQLEDELKHHVWAVSESNCNQKLLEGHGDNYWHKYVKTLGEEFRGWLYHPENPQMN